MLTSRLLNVLTENPGFVIGSVTVDDADEKLAMECQFLKDVQDHKITTKARDGKQLTVTYPDGTSTLILYRGTSDDYMVYPSGTESYEATIEECRGVSALVSRGEVVMVLPSDIIRELHNN